MTIPNDFVPCEVYRNWTIAVKLGSYSIWNRLGLCAAGSANTRAEARRLIDQQIKDQQALLEQRRSCEHDWQIDTPCMLVDTCSKCGEQRS